MPLFRPTPMRARGFPYDRPVYPDALPPRLALLRTLADRADTIALSHFQRVGLATRAKADESPVTEADLAIEASLRAAILAACPEDAILGEEHGETRGRASDAGGFRWLIDPIDGTISFASGVPLFGTLIGLEHEGRIVAGTCSMPALGERVTAAEGRGATWERAGRAPEPAKVRPCPGLASALVCTSGLEYYRRADATDALVRLGRAAGRIRGWSDCYGGLLVATGRADGWIDPVMNPWDSGPFPVILAEAGGVFSDWRGGGGAHGGSAIAGCPKVHRELLELVRGSAAPS